MTLEQAMKLTADRLDQLREASDIEYQDALVRNGADADTIDELLLDQARSFDRWKAKTLHEVRLWLEHGAMTQH